MVFTRLKDCYEEPCRKISNLVFFCYRSLKCHRTRIHRNLFSAILLHVVIRLVNHIDHLVARTSGEEVGGAMVMRGGTIYNTVSTIHIFTPENVLRKIMHVMQIKSNNLFFISIYKSYKKSHSNYAGHKLDPFTVM